MYATTAEQERAAVVRELAADLYTEHYHRLRGIAYSNCGRWTDPEDAVQEAFAIFIAEYDPEAGSPPLRWLGLTLTRLCWATTARRRMAARMGIAASASTPMDRPSPRPSAPLTPPLRPSTGSGSAGRGRE